MPISKSSKLFLERVGLRPTYRRPCPTISVGTGAIHDYTVSRPMPRVEAVTDGFPPPDKPLTTNDPWPFGEETQVAP